MFSFTGMKTTDNTTTPVDVDTNIGLTVNEFPSEPSYVNISNESLSSAPLSFVGIGVESSAVGPRGHWNPVYVGMDTRRTAGPVSTQVRTSRITGRDHQIPSEDRNPLNRRDRSHGSDYLEIIP